MELKLMNEISTDVMHNGLPLEESDNEDLRHGASEDIVEDIKESKESIKASEEGLTPRVKSVFAMTRKCEAKPNVSLTLI
jgi:hypothetical protein